MQPYAICKDGNRWLRIGSNPKIGRDIAAMFGSANTPATYANPAAAKRVIKILESRGVIGLAVCETPVPLGPDEDISDLIYDDGVIQYNAAQQPLAVDLAPLGN